MDVVYQYQSELRITINTGVSLVGATSIILKLVKPSGAELTYNLSPLDADAGVTYWDVIDDATLDELGFWKGWVYITFPSGGKAPTHPFIIKVIREGYTK